MKLKHDATPAQKKNLRESEDFLPSRFLAASLIVQEKDDAVDSDSVYDLVFWTIPKNVTPLGVTCNALPPLDNNGNALSINIWIKSKRKSKIRRCFFIDCLRAGRPGYQYQTDWRPWKTRRRPYCDKVHSQTVLLPTSHPIIARMDDGHNSMDDGHDSMPPPPM